MPAGSVNLGETPEQAAVRECHEEIEKLPRQIERLGEFYSTPGYCDELMIFFRLTELMEPDRFAEADDDEDIEARLFTLDEASQLVSNGEAPDMKTALGLTLL